MSSPNRLILDAVLDMLSFAIFVVDEDRRPVYVNAAASALLAEGQPFHLDQAGILRVTAAADEKALRVGIANLRRDPPGDARRVVPFYEGGTNPGIFIWLSALPETAGGGTSLMVTRRSQANGAGLAVLAELFGLTSAESRLLQGLLCGVSPTQYAVRQTLSLNTVRNQLKSIFEKTDVRRQSDLVSLACSVLAPVTFDRPES